MSGPIEDILFVLESHACNLTHAGTDADHVDDGR